nr:MAG TPA: hypothetical protein [Caudoviricetes sp.]
MFEMHRNNIYLIRGDTGIVNFAPCFCDSGFLTASNAITYTIVD